MRTTIFVFTAVTLISVLMLGVSQSRKGGVYGIPSWVPDGPYLGQSPPGLIPEIFAPGAVSLPDRRETKIAFSPDGQQCLFQVKKSLHYTKCVNGSWSKPVVADFLGSGGGAEPFFSLDGKKFFFVRNADIWMTEVTSEEPSIPKMDGKPYSQWSKPKKLDQPVNTSAEEWHPTVASDGTLYFCSSRYFPQGGYNIYLSRLVDGEYSTVEKLDTVINTEYGAWDPFISPDESYLMFSTSLPGGYGQVDQYISYRDEEEGSWGAPIDLGPDINTGDIEYGSYVSCDGKYYFFSRPEGWGVNHLADIYWVDAKAVLSSGD